MVLLVLNHVVEDGDRALVAQRFELFAVAGDVPALLDFKAAQGHADAAGAVGQRIGLAALFAAVDGLASAQLDDASVPELGVLQLGGRQMAQHLGAHRIGVAIRQRLVGVVALHLRLPAVFERLQDFVQANSTQSLVRQRHLSGAPC